MDDLLGKFLSELFERRVISPETFKLCCSKILLKSETSLKDFFSSLAEIRSCADELDAYLKLHYCSIDIF